MYYTRFAQNQRNVIFSDGSIELIKAQLLEVTSYIDEIPQLNWGDDLKLYLKFIVKKSIDVPLFRIQIFDKELRPIAAFESNTNSSNIKIENNLLRFVMTHKKLQLSKGIFSIDIALFIANSNDPVLRVNGVVNFHVMHKEDQFQPFLLSVNYENCKI